MPRVASAKKKIQSIEPALEPMDAPNDKIIIADVLSSTVNRTAATKRFNKIYGKTKKDKTLAKDTESGVYDHAIAYTISNQLDPSIVPNVYESFVMDLELNLNPKSRLENTYLLSAVKSGMIDAKALAGMSPRDLHPSIWKPLVDRMELRRKKQNNVATTDQYPCKRCGAREAIVSQLQTRSADEPMTTFVTCVKCKATIKF